MSPPNCGPKENHSLAIAPNRNRKTGKQERIAKDVSHLTGDVDVAYGI